MLRYKQHISVWLLVMAVSVKTTAQVAMPDTVCVGTNRTYKVNDAATPSTYTWKVNGITQLSTKNDINISWNNAGVYTITVQEHANGGCDGDIRSGTVYVLAPPVPNAGPDQVICFGSTATLNGSGGGIYQWLPPNYLSATNIARPVMSAPFAGVYRYVLDVTNAFGCRATQKDTVVITVLPPVKIFAGNDTSISVNQQLQLNAIDINNSGFVSYLWTPSTGLNSTAVKNPLAKFSSTIGNNGITYRVTARTAAGCEASDDITVKIFAQADIYVPNAFTPNGDGLNDVIRPVLAGIRELKYFRVFNRYGEMVFATGKPGEGWNGIYKGERQNAGGFTWMAEAVDYRGNIIQKNGVVVLIR